MMTIYVCVNFKTSMELMHIFFIIHDLFYNYCSNARIGVLYILFFFKLYLDIILFQTLRGL